MSTPDNNGLLQWIIGVLCGALSGLFGYHKYLESRFSKKADKEELTELSFELGKIRDHIRENEQRAQDRHERLMERLTGER